MQGNIRFRVLMDRCKLLLISPAAPEGQSFETLTAWEKRRWRCP